MSTSRSARCRAAIALTVCTLLAAAGCGPAKPVAPEGTLRVSLGVSREALSGLAYIARDEGLFEAAGLDVTFTEYSSSQLAMEALLAGDADAALCADTPIVLSALDGSEVRIVATVGTDSNDLKIVARSDAGIRDPADLLGKRVGTRKGTAAHFFLHGFLIKHGMADADVVLTFDSFEAVTEALIAGDLDAVALRQPFISQLERALDERFVLFEEEGLYGKTMNLVVDSDGTAPDPEVQRRLVSAFLAAERAGISDLGRSRAEVADALDIPEDQLCGCIIIEGAVCLRQSLVLGLEDQMRWARDSGLSASAARPDVLLMLDTAPLDAVAPERVTVIR